MLAPGAQYGGSTPSKINLLSLGIALVLGTAGLPHVLMRFYTVPTAKEARRSVVWAIALIGAFYLFTLVLGYGAAALVGPDRILAAAGGQNCGGAAAGLRTRRRDPARRHLGGRLRDDPGRRRRPDDHRVGVLRPRRLRQRDEEPRGHRGRAGAGFPHHRGGARRSPPSGSASWPTDRTSRSWSPWRSRSPPRRTCRPSSTRCTGSGSTPAGRCGACTAG